MRRRHRMAVAARAANRKRARLRWWRKLWHHCRSSRQSRRRHASWPFTWKHRLAYHSRALGTQSAMVLAVRKVRKVPEPVTWVRVISECLGSSRVASTVACGFGFSPTRALLAHPWLALQVAFRRWAIQTRYFTAPSYSKHVPQVVVASGRASGGRSGWCGRMAVSSRTWRSCRLARLRLARTMAMQLAHWSRCGPRGGARLTAMTARLSSSRWTWAIARWCRQTYGGSRVVASAVVAAAVAPTAQEAVVLSTHLGW
mmetsp:Transcript_35938/g.96287  ORF Transcript_35938/g.96287 Transcript_35938/m.96287 type:complete len:257 (+) Transcript_35938:1400-2170(+)